MMDATTKKTLTLERTFDCTPERLWEAWTKPAQYARWLNPAPEMDLIMHEWDLRPGGRIRFDMPQPNGDVHPQTGMFHEIDPPRRLVSGEEDKSFLIDARFEPAGEGKTRLVVEITGLPEEWREPATQGWNAGFDKLEALVTDKAGPVETRSIELERAFDCTPQELWDAWTRPERLARWFGPMPDAEVGELDVRPGGKIRLAMVDEKGEKYPVWGEFQELDAPRLLVFTAQALEVGGQVTTVRVEIESVDGRTRMRLRQTGVPSQVAGDTGEGWQMSWDKLWVQVAEGRSIVIKRHIKAPRERVFDAFTDPEAVEKWWGPDGFTTTTKQMDVRPAGKWVFTMHGPDGTDYPNWILYEVVQRPVRLVYAHGAGRDEPEFHGVIAFYEQDGGTLVTLSTVLPTKEARDHAVKKIGAIEGGEQTLARLAEHVEGKE